MRVWHVFAAFLLVGFLLYGNVLSYPFVHDDYIFIVGNAQIGRWDNMSQVFLGKPSGMAIDQGNVNAYYRPLLDVVNRFLFLLFGGLPRGYHFFNILCHVLNGVLVFLILRSMAIGPLMAFGCGLLFLVHPVQSEAVCAIAGISNLLSAFFCFLSFLFYLRYRSAVRVFSKNARLVAAGFFFLLALLCKESIVILPALVLLYALLFPSGQQGQKKWSRYFLPLGVYLLFLAGYFTLRRLSAVSMPAIFDHPGELGLRLLSIPQTFLMYVRILILPADLHYYRSLDILHFSFLPIGMMLTLLVGVIWLSRKLDSQVRKVFYFGIGWFVIALAPMMNIVPLINEYALILTSEHFLYVPLFGFLLAILAAARWAYRILPAAKIQRIAIAFFVLAVFLLALIAKEQSRYWQGEIPLFQRTLRYQPQFGRVRILLARAYYFNGDYDLAIEEYQRALDIITGYAQRSSGTKAQATYEELMFEIHFDLAHCYEALQDPFRALDEYRRALSFRPNDGRVYNNMGLNYFFIREFDKAAACFRRALKLDPRDIMALNNLAFYHIHNANYSRAEGILRRALKLDPLSGSLRQNLQEVLATKKEVLEREKKR